MKKLILATVAAVGLAAPSLAADMPAPAEYYAESDHDWSGFYAGVHVGYGFGTAEFGLYPSGGGPLNASDTDADGVILGGQLGFNIQSGSWVYGLEGDIAWTDLTNEDEINTTTIFGQADLEWLATIRGRVGHAFDRTLVYATGGVAIGKIEELDHINGTTDTNTHVGFAFGAGLEHAFSDRMSAKLEYLYVDLGEEMYDTLAVDPITLTAHTIKVGVNFHF